MPPTPHQPTHHTNQLAHEVYLVLTFPDLATVYHARSYLSAIADAARQSDNLVILVRITTSPAFASSSTSVQPPATSSSSASRSSACPSSSATPSASASSSTDTSPSPLSTALTDFHQLQRFLSRLYSAATRAFLADDRPLAKAEVVIEELRGIPFCVPTGANVQTITVQQEEVDHGKGKGIPHGDDDDGDGYDRTDSERGEMPRREGYPVVALGGTFDHLHAGHRILLTLAAYITKDDGRLIVGVSGKLKLGTCLRRLSYTLRYSR